MVNLIYRGQNYVLIGKYKIVNGNNEIQDDDFYKLMKSPIFALRVNQKIFEVPKDFPLERPVVETKKETKKESENKEDQNEDHDEDHDENNSPDRLSAKQTLKLIQKSDDANFLKELIDSDDRSKIKEAAQKKLDSLEEETK